jgi:multicomponent Na+:H+ antiporter subunit F
MATLLNSALYIALPLYLIMTAVAVWRIWRGENVIDRLIGVDLVGTLFLSILVLIALIYRESIFIDLALALAALGFISTIALAKYIADEQMY